LTYGIDANLSDEDTPVDRGITGYQQDDEGHWGAELECGHRQHIRHNPPWVNRPWVTTAEGRTAALGRPPLEWTYQGYSLQISAGVVF
jgi:Protein of unknown function (DUF3565)